MLVDGKNIARVFPRQTSYSPIDCDAFFDAPDFFTPKDLYDEIHVCVTFTWDIEYGNYLAKAWEGYAPVIKIGGVAYKSPADNFVKGLYVKEGVTFTSRGCVRSCDFCFVPKIEGKLKLLPIQEGNIIQDNNFLATPQTHRDAVYEMLRTQTNISFRGGLDARLLREHDIDAMRGLRIYDLWFACDSREELDTAKKLAKKISCFSQRKKRCYVLIGDDIKENEYRLRTLFELGFLPFAQLFRNEKNDIEYSKQFKDLARTFSRPAATITAMKEQPKYF